MAIFVFHEFGLLLYRGVLENIGNIGFLWWFVCLLLLILIDRKVQVETSKLNRRNSNEKKGYELGLTSIQFLEPNLLKVPDALGVVGSDCCCCTVWV